MRIAEINGEKKHIQRINCACQHDDRKNRDDRTSPCIQHAAARKTDVKKIFDEAIDEFPVVPDPGLNGGKRFYIAYILGRLVARGAQFPFFAMAANDPVAQAAG